MFNRLKRAWAALTGPRSGHHEDNATRIAKLQMELQRKEEETDRLREEYQRQEAGAKQEADLSIQATLAKVMRELANPLSQLAAMRQRLNEDKDVRAEDVLKVAASMERSLAEHGLEPVGQIGQHMAFDPSIHQRMSGGDVTEGAPIYIRFPGYRYNDETALKAMVTRIEPEGGDQ